MEFADSDRDGYLSFDEYKGTPKNKQTKKQVIFSVVEKTQLDTKSVPVT